MSRVLLALFLPLALSGCIATKVVTTTAGVATKVAVGTVKTTGKVAAGTVDLVIPDGEDDERVDEDVHEED